MKKDLPTLKILKITDLPNGDADVEFEIDDNFKKFYQQQTGAKKVTEKGLGKFILKMLEKAVDQEDGYGMKTID